MVSPKYLDVKELAELTNVKEDFIIELCCVEKISYLGVPIDPIFKADELDQLIEIIQQKGEKS
jgi:hypothetical protein